MSKQGIASPLPLHNRRASVRFNGKHVIFILPTSREKVKSKNRIVAVHDPSKDFDERVATEENIKEAQFLTQQSKTKRTVVVKVKDALKFKPRLAPEELCINLKENKVYSEYDDPSWHCWVCVCETDRAHRTVTDLENGKSADTDVNIQNISNSTTKMTAKLGIQSEPSFKTELKDTASVKEYNSVAIVGQKRHHIEYEGKLDQDVKTSGDEGEGDDVEDEEDSDESDADHIEEEETFDIDETPEERSQRLENEAAELEAQKEMIEYYAQKKAKAKAEHESRTGQPYVPDPPRKRRGDVQDSDLDRSIPQADSSSTSPILSPNSIGHGKVPGTNAATGSGMGTSTGTGTGTGSMKLKLRMGTVNTLARLKELVGLPPVVIEDSDEFKLQPNDHICGCLVMQQFVHDSNYFQWGIPLHRTGPPDPVSGAFPDVAELSVFCAKGCGGKLLEAAVDYAAKHTPYKFIITASSHGAESWYTSKGFKPVTALRMPMPSVTERRAMTRQQRLQMSHLYRHRIPDAMIDITRDEPSLVMYLSVPARVRQQQQLIQKQLRLARGIVTGQAVKKPKGPKGKYKRRNKTVKLDPALAKVFLETFGGGVLQAAKVSKDENSSLQYPPPKSEHTLSPMQLSVFSQTTPQGNVINSQESLYTHDDTNHTHGYHYHQSNYPFHQAGNPVSNAGRSEYVNQDGYSQWAQSHPNQNDSFILERPKEVVQTNPIIVSQNIGGHVHGPIIPAIHSTQASQALSQHAQHQQSHGLQYTQIPHISAHQHGYNQGGPIPQVQPLPPQHHAPVSYMFSIPPNVSSGRGRD